MTSEIIDGATRWVWCHGDGRWERAGERDGVHHDMYWTTQEPNERNFSGTPTELGRARKQWVKRLASVSP